ERFRGSRGIQGGAAEQRKECALQTSARRPSCPGSQRGTIAQLPPTSTSLNNPATACSRCSCCAATNHACGPSLRKPNTAASDPACSSRLSADQSEKDRRSTLQCTCASRSPPSRSSNWSCSLACHSGSQRSCPSLNNDCQRRASKSC